MSDILLTNFLYHMNQYLQMCLAYNVSFVRQCAVGLADCQIAWWFFLVVAEPFLLPLLHCKHQKV